MKKQDKFIEVTTDGKQEIEEGKEPLNKPSKEYPVDAAQSNYQDAQTEEYRKKKLKKEDKINGGLADNDKPSDFDKKQLEMGIKVEMEHTKDKGIAREIAMDHLKEFPDYYTRLNDMEEDADKDKKKMSKSILERWELIKKDLKHEDAFMDIDIEGDKDEKETEEDGEEPTQGEEGQPEGQDDEQLSEDEIQGLLGSIGSKEEMEDTDGDGILEGTEEGEEPVDTEDSEEGGSDEPDTATESEEDIPADVIQEAGGEEEIEKLPPEEIEKLMTEMGYSSTEIAHVIHGHTVHHDPEDERKQEMHEHELAIKQQEMAMGQAKSGAETEHVENINSIDIDRVGKLNDIEIEHERRMKELDYNMARRARELELKYKEKELEQKLKHKDKDAKVKREDKKDDKSNKHERKLVDNVVN